jgi:hypothetical protein
MRMIDKMAPTPAWTTIHCVSPPIRGEDQRMLAISSPVKGGVITLSTAAGEGLLRRIPLRFEKLLNPKWPPYLPYPDAPTPPKPW